MFDFFVKDILRLVQDGENGRKGDKIRSFLRGVSSPGFRAVAVYRAFRWARRRHIPVQPLRYGIERWVEVTTGISIPAEAEFGPGLRIHHFGGIIVHPSVTVGARCTLYHGVTLGTDGLTEKAPRLGDDVLVGAGAKVLGGIDIGDRCRIGANAVVVDSAPPDSVLVGVPARIVVSRRRPSVASERIGPGARDDEGAVAAFPAGGPGSYRGR